MDIPKAIQEAVQTVAAGLFPLATALAAVGVLSMALLQTAKDLFPLRRWFQAARVRAWLRAQAAQAPPIPGAAVNADTAEADLIRLATSGDRAALFDLPIEQVTGQINAAGRIVLDFPWEHEHLFRCLAAQANADDVRKLIESRPPAQGPRPALGAEEKSALIDARNRVTHQAQRSLDGLQISAGFRWKLYLQMTSIGLSGLIVWAGLMLFVREPIEVFVRHLPLYAATAVVGGFLAPVARELVAALEGLRKK
jgi:hypothetical protein